METRCPVRPSTRVGMPVAPAAGPASTASARTARLALAATCPRNSRREEGWGMSGAPFLSRIAPGLGGPTFSPPRPRCQAKLTNGPPAEGTWKQRAADCFIPQLRVAPPSLGGLSVVRSTPSSAEEGWWRYGVQGSGVSIPVHDRNSPADCGGAARPRPRNACPGLRPHSGRGAVGWGDHGSRRQTHDIASTR